jgi:hypothetical protein
MARKSMKSAPPVEPEDEAQEVPQPIPSPDPTKKTMTKTQAARAAIADGVDSPTEAVAFIKKRFGIEMTPQHFSSIKFQQQKKSEEQPPTGQRGRKVKATQAVEGYLAPPRKPPAMGVEPDLLAAIEAMKPLVAALGSDKVKRIADLLG